MKNIFFEIHGRALDSFEVIICKIQISIILVLKVWKLGWIEYVDKDVFTALTCLGFHLEHKVNKEAYTNVFQSLLLFVFFSKVYWKKKSREKSIPYTRVFCAVKLQMHLYVESFLWIEFGNKFFYLLFGCLWDISEPFLKGHFFSFWPEDHKECCEKVVPLNLEDRLVGFKQRNFWFNCNILVH